MNERAKAILNFWFLESHTKYWFSKNNKFDKFRIKLNECNKKA